MNDMCGMELFQFLNWPETPRDTTRLNFAVGITNVKSLVYSDVCDPQNIFDNLWIGFGWDTFPLTEYGGEMDLWKEMSDQLLCCCLVFVGGDG